jgi:hypothetical protein
MRFSLVVTTGNAAAWIGRCIQSIAEQKTRWSWQCLIIDDASNDGTKEAIELTLSSIHDPAIRSRFLSHRNAMSRGALANFVHGFSKLGTIDRPMDVLVQVDGDDWLFCNSSLEIVAQTYEQTDCWLTYGGLTTFPDGVCYSIPVSESVIAGSQHRHAPWKTSHLRSFRSHLWHAIKDEDLRDREGKYYQTTGDMAVMLPMVEMAGERIQCIKKEIYAYNTINPNSVHIDNRDKQLRAEHEIRERPAYQRLIQAQPPRKDKEPQNELGFVILSTTESDQSRRLIQSIKTYYRDARVLCIHSTDSKSIETLPENERLGVLQSQGQFERGSLAEAETIVIGLQRAANQWSRTNWFAVIDHESHPLVSIDELLAALSSSPYDGYIQTGSQCMILRRTAVVELLKFRQAQLWPEFFYLWHTESAKLPATEESFIQTALCYQKNLTLCKEGICWEDSEIGGPRVLKKEDWKKLHQSKHWLARRFSEPESSSLIDKIHDEWMLNAK